MINLRTLITGLVLGFFAGWLYGAIQRENAERKAQEAFVNDAEYIEYKKARQRMIETENWLDDVEENLP